MQFTLHISSIILGVVTLGASIILASNATARIRPITTDRYLVITPWTLLFGGITGTAGICVGALLK